MFLKQSTAATIILGPFVDSTDGVTAETSLTISQADVRLSKNGAAFAQKSDTGAASHMEHGNYSCALNTTDTGTLGRLRVAVNESGALPVWADFMVLPANVWDSLFGADKLQVHVDEMTAGIITAAVIAAGAIDADALAADAVDEIWDEVMEGSLTGRQFMRIFMSALAGESAGGGTGTITFRDLADTKNRISATVDANRNRTAVTRDGS